jgi:hypothetical protein
MTSHGNKKLSKANPGDTIEGPRRLMTFDCVGEGARFDVMVDPGDYPALRAERVYRVAAAVAAQCRDEAALAASLGVAGASAAEEVAQGEVVRYGEMAARARDARLRRSVPGVRVLGVARIVE